MTNPLAPVAYPAPPATPSGAPAGYSQPSEPPNLPSTLPGAEDAAARRGQFYELILQQVMLALTGFVPGAGQAFDLLKSWGLDLENILGGPGLGSGSVNPVEWAGNFVNTILMPLNLLLGRNSRIPISQLTDERVNLAPTPTFPVGCIANPFEWNIDPAVTRTPDDSGSLFIEANGRPHSVVTGKDPLTRMLINPGKETDLSIYVRHLGYTGSESPIQLWAYPWVGETRLDKILLTSYTPTASALIDWPGQLIKSTYTFAPNVTSVQKRIYVASTALAGQFWFDDVEVSQTPLVPAEWVSQLPEALQDLLGRIFLISDTFVNELLGLDGEKHPIESLITAITNLSPLNMLGVNGGENILDSLFGIVNSIAGGGIGQQVPAGENVGLPALFGIIQEISSRAFRGASAFDIASVRNNTPMTSGLLKTGQSNRDLSVIRAKASPVFYAVTTTTAVAADRVQVPQPIGVIEWYGYGVTSITDFRIDVWRRNGTTDVLLHHSANLVSILDASATSGNPKPMFYQLPTPIPAQAFGDEILYEFTSVGGTHNILCDEEGAWATLSHPHADTQAYAFSRVNSTPTAAPSSLAHSSFTAMRTIPWVEQAIELGDYSGTYDPVTFYRNNGDPVIRPPWAAVVDVIPIGQGGRAAASPIPGFFGRPGDPGIINAVSWHLGEHFDSSLTELSFDPATRSVTIDAGFGPITVSTTDGVNGAGTLPLLISPKPIGRAPGPLDFKGQSYPLAREDQKAWGGEGTEPGGGANGAHPLIGFITGSGAGGKPGCYFRFRQFPDPGEVVGSGTGDITAPTAPTLIALVGATPSTVTLAISGGSD